MNLIIPNKLKRGDTVAAITLSWGGAGLLTHRYNAGKEFLENRFGVKVVETPNALQSPEWIYNNPQKRLEDLMWAVENPQISGIISMIGGNDSIRMLDFLTEEHLIKIYNNPKIFMGMSDTTVTHYIFRKAGVRSYYGPAMMYGFAENLGMHDYAVNSVYKELFEPDVHYTLEECTEGWTMDLIPWDAKNQNIKRKMQVHTPWLYIQGNKPASGPLIGGCMEVLEMLKGTKIWPDLEDFKGAILFLEIAEDMSSSKSNLVLHWLRNYGATGILSSIAGIIFARPGGEIQYDNTDYSNLVNAHIARFSEYNEVFLKVCKEYCLADLPIVTNVDFGHTCPMLVLPYDAKTTIEPQNKRITIK